MTKKIFAIIVLALAFLYTGCQPIDSNPDGVIPRGDEYVLKAIVKSVDNPSRLKVEVVESDYAFGIYIVHTENADFTDATGTSISVSDIRVGDTVKITYGGQVMMSNPPQIVAHKIEKN